MSLRDHLPGWKADELTDEQVDAVARFAEMQASTDLMRAADALAIRHPVLAVLASGLGLLVEWRTGKDGR